MIARWAALLAAFWLALSTGSRAAASPTPTGLRLTVSPTVARVGDAAVFTLTAKSWPTSARASLAFRSAHHGFTGPMTWVPPCSCFRIAVRLVRRIHPLEQAQASATLHFDATSTTTNTSFQIRGLAPNGRDFSPGGVTVLTGWVSDPAPFQGEYQHFCAWTHTIDFLPVPHERVGFVAHYANRTVRWNPGSTGPTGIYCSHRSIGKARSGYPVKVDIYAGPLSTQTSFTPRP